MPPKIIFVVLFMNLLGKALKPFILALSGDFGRTIILRMLYPSTGGNADLYAFFLFEVVQPLILSYPIFLIILKKKLGDLNLICVVILLILDSFFVIYDLIKLNFDKEFGLEAVYRAAVEKTIKLSPADQQSLRDRYDMSNYTWTAISVHTYFITNVVFKIFSAYIIYSFKSRSNAELVVSAQDTPLHELSARRTVDCEEGTGIVPPAPSAPPIDEGSSQPQRLYPLILPHGSLIKRSM